MKRDRESKARRDTEIYAEGRSASPDRESLPVAVRDDRAANSTRKIDSLGDIHPAIPNPPVCSAFACSISLLPASLRAPGIACDLCRFVYTARSPQHLLRSVGRRRT